MNVVSSVTVRVPGKVNVYLGVGPRGFGGYHELSTVFQSVNVYDEVTVRSSTELSITVEGLHAESIPTDSSNLVWKAAELVARASGEDPHVAIHIKKAIPVAAGMAGGSADAAATLLACDALWQAGIPRDQLDAMAAELGSDVPFMLHGGCALGTGRGDLLSPVMTRGSFHWVFATFEQGLSTAEIYAHTDELRGPDFDVDPDVPTELLAALAHGDARALGMVVHNDLEAAAISKRPQLQQVLDAGLDFGALGALVSGSGPTCAFLVDSEADAINLVVALSSTGLVGDCIRAHGPVHGARVVHA